MSPRLDGVLSAVVSTMALPPSSTRGVISFAGSFSSDYKGVGLEFRLADDDERVDLGVCVDRQQARALLGSAEGTQCGEILRRWVQGDTPLFSRISHTWLEFDISRSGKPHDGWKSSFPFLSLREALGEARTDSRSLAELLGTIPGLDTAAACRALLAALPPNAIAAHLSAITHRAVPEVRLQWHAQRAVALHWLRDHVATQRSSNDVLEELERIDVPLLAVQTAWSEGSVRPISLEIHLPQSPRFEATKHTLGQALTRCTHASQAKVDRALSWIGTTSYDIEREPARVGISRDLHFTVKLGDPPEVKAYAYFCPRYVLQ